MSQSISILSSQLSNGPYKNLGGPPSVQIIDNELSINGIFHWDSIHGGEVFNVVYIKNTDYTQTSPDIAAVVEVRIKTEDIEDVIMKKYLGYLSIDIFIPSYITTNYEHPAITPDGYFIDSYPKRITDFVSADLLNRSVVFLDDSLAPGEFIPIILRTKLSGPIGTVFKLPISFNTYIGVF